MEAKKLLEEAVISLKSVMDNSNEQITQSDIRRVLNDLVAVLYQNTRKESDKFDYYKFCAKDQSRPVLNGIFHDNGNVVATNGHILLVVKEEYDPIYEGKSISKAGTVIEGRFPNWKAVIPKFENEGKTLDLNRIIEIRDQMLLDKKIEPNKKFMMRVNGKSIRLDLLSLCIKFLNKFPKAVFNTKEDNYGAMVFEYEENICIVMPYFEDENSKVYEY